MRMTRFKAAAAALAVLATGSVAHAEELVVWDFKSTEPAMKPYFDFIRETFEAKHPGVTLQQVVQPADSYYAVLGTAINAKQGPDVALVHSGNQSLDRADAFVPLNEQVADVVPNLAGLLGFKLGEDKGYVALPLTVQGAVFYYNKEVYTAAGLDAEKAPETWEDFAAACEAIKANTEASCLTLGNKDGVDFINLIAVLADGVWSDETRAQFIANELAYTSDEMRAVFARMQEMIDKGWLEQGMNSYSPYTDAVNIFAGARTGHILGLISDAPNSWKNLESLMDEGTLGVAMPVAIGKSAADKPVRLEVDGGIGFAVTNWSDKQDLAIDFVRIATSPEAGVVLMESAGGLPSNIAVDTTPLNSPGATAINGFMNCCKKDGRIKSYYGVPERRELQRLGQLLVTGDVTVDEVLEGVEAVRQAELAKQ